ncbi:MAG: hypothetical protein AAF927_05760 [Bacteroidota bacterium]
MKEPLLTQMLTKLSASDLDEFDLFLQSPLFNKVKRLHLFFQTLRREAFRTAREKVYRQIYPEAKDFDAQKWYEACSQLRRLLEQYLAWRQFDREPSPPLQTLMDLRMDQTFEKQLKRSRRELAHQSQRDSRFFQRQFELGAAADAYFGLQQKRAPDENLETLVEGLDLYYLTEKLKYSCEMLNRNNILQPRYDPKFCADLIKLLEGGAYPYLAEPIIAIYYQIFSMLSKEENESHFQKLVQLLQKHGASFEAQEANAMYTYAQNYCVRQINKGQRDYLEPYFELGLDMLAKDLLLEDGYLPHWHYKNLITVGTRLQRYDWVADFLDAYRERLSPAFQESAYYYNLAAFHYERALLSEAMRFLQQVDFPDVFYNLAARTLQLKIFLESKDYDSLHYHAKAFRHFLRRNRAIGSDRRKLYETFIRLTLAISRWQVMPEGERRNQKGTGISLQLQAQSALIEKAWLLKQMA